MTLQQIMHRDIKPDNLLVSHSGVVKLADFGDARATNDAVEPLTRDAGTKEFSAPEMLVMDPEYNKWVSSTGGMDGHYGTPLSQHSITTALTTSRLVCFFFDI